MVLKPFLSVENRKLNCGHALYREKVDKVLGAGKNKLKLVTFSVAKVTSDLVPMGSSLVSLSLTDPSGLVVW